MPTDPRLERAGADARTSLSAVERAHGNPAARALALAFYRAYEPYIPSWDWQERGAIRAAMQRLADPEKEARDG